MSDPEPRGVIIWQNMRRGRLKASKLWRGTQKLAHFKSFIERWEERNGELQN